jgi:hypothetical protein
MQAACEVVQFPFRQVENLVGGERGALLLLERETWRCGRQVPVDVPVRLLAPEAEDVQALGWNGAPDRLTDAMNDTVEADVLIEGEVAGDLLSMTLRGNENVPVQNGKAVQERDGVIVLVDDAVLIVRIPCEHLADEAATSE